MEETKRKPTEEELEIKAILVSFLEANSAYGKFTKNLVRCNSWHSATAIDEYVQYLSGCGCFAGEAFEFAFDWAKTKEGDRYWSKMSDKFRKHLKTLQSPIFKEELKPTITKEIKPVVEVFAEKVN